MKRLLGRGSSVGCSGGFRASGKTLVPKVNFVASSAFALAADWSEPLGLIAPPRQRVMEGGSKGSLGMERAGVTLEWSHPCHPDACAESLVPGEKYPSHLLGDFLPHPLDQDVTLFLKLMGC